MGFTDYYELLQISATADIEIVNAAYKRLAMRYHPDTGGPDKSEDMMKLLNEAWSVLGDADSRANYDYFWDLERKKKEIIKFIKFLIEQKKYEEARAILIRFDHPIAQKCLAQIDKILADQRARQGAYAQAEPAYAGGYGAPGPRSRRQELDDLAERRIQEIKRREEQRASTQQQESVRQAREQQRARAYRDVLVRTYERVGAYAFQWEDIDALETEMVPKNKTRAWDAVEAKRYEIARWYIAKSSNADQNMRDWSLLIEHILASESPVEKLTRLGVKGFFRYPLRIFGLQATILTWLSLLLAVVVVLGYFAPTFEAFAGVVVVALVCVVGILIRFVRDRYIVS